ncbi:zinc-binding dehydrogenase (plasmid) [Agrobacterium leguminum]|uniref:zinc-binding dehydrogenase n=1 Tax=Agrobacterium leguminum TaxID=2792015 RepID=UPI0030CB5F33
MNMRAVIMRHGALGLEEISIPRPGPGEVLVKTLATGICGSDLHAAKHGGELLASARAVTGLDLFDMNEPVIMGHEFCAEVVEHGPDCQQTHPIGTRVVSAPFLMRPRPVTLIFGSPETPGGYAQYMVLSEALLIPVPDHVPDDVATLAEPLAVAIHAVNRGNVGADDVPIVIGCGPIGLAVIAVLKMRGIGPIVASDFSAKRREMAATLGADVVVDPREISPFEAWRSVAATSDPDRMSPQTQMFPGFAFRRSVVFECVGVRGVLQQVLAETAPRSHIVVVGLCMEEDRIFPSYGIIKEVDVTFCIAFTAQEYVEAFTRIAAGDLKVAPMITSHIGLEGVPDAFITLGGAEKEAKVIVLPNKR